MKSAMAAKAAPVKSRRFRIAVVESDPLRFVGFRALFDNEVDFELIRPRFRHWQLAGG